MSQIHRNYSYHHNRTSRIQPQARPRRKIPFKTITIILTVIVAIGGIRSILPSSGDSDVKGVAVASEDQKEPPKKTVDTTNLEAELAAIIKQYPYDTSVSVIELNSGKIIQTGDDYPFLAASTTKILTALYYLSEVEKGSEKLDADIGGKPAKTQLQLMINKSDNPAWKLLNDHLSRESLETYAKQHGLTSYDPIKNTITSNDIASLLSKLYKKELLNDDNTKLLLGWMQNTSEERFIPPAVPKSSKLYHKSGYLDDRVHDVAIIDNGSTPFVLVIYSKSYRPDYDYIRGQKLFSQVTTKTLNTFGQ